MNKSSANRTIKKNNKGERQEGREAGGRREARTRSCQWSREGGVGKGKGKREREKEGCREQEQNREGRERDNE